MPLLIFRFLRSTQAILLAIAIVIGYPHARQIWLDQSSKGFCSAFNAEWHKAGIPMAIALAFVLVIFTLEFIKEWKHPPASKKDIEELSNKISSSLPSKSDIQELTNSINRLNRLLEKIDIGKNKVDDA